MISISQDIIVLQKVIAIGILLLLIIVSFSSPKSPMKIVATFITLFVIVAHYAVLLSFTKYVNVAIYPFIVIESASGGSVLYVDFGQLLLVLLLIAWRNEFHGFLKRSSRWKRCARIER